MLGLRTGAHDSTGPRLLLPVLAESAAETLAEGPDSVAGRAACSPSLDPFRHSRMVSTAGSSARQRGRFPPRGKRERGAVPRLRPAALGRLDGTPGPQAQAGFAAMPGVDHPGVG